MEIDVLCHGVTRKRLKEAVRSRRGYHIVHWSGHGHHNALDLQGEPNNCITGESLVGLFSEAGGFIPQVFFLSAMNDPMEMVRAIPAKPFRHRQATHLERSCVAVPRRRARVPVAVPSPTAGCQKRGSGRVAGYAIQRNTWLMALPVPEGEHELVVKDFVFPPVWARPFTPIIGTAAEP